MKRSLPGMVVREPLVHFVVIAAMILLGLRWSAGTDREKIVVTADTIAGLERLQTDILGRPPTDDETTRAIDAWIEDEVLVREARKLGFDNDGRVRKHLSAKMRFFLDERQPDPTNEQLRAFYEADPQRSTVPDQFAVKLLTVPAEQMDATLESLRSGGNTESVVTGGGVTTRLLSRYSHNDLAREFGAAFADAVVSLEDDGWHGPIASTRGTHVVRIEERFEGGRLPFEQIKRSLRDEWEFERRRETVRARVSELASTEYRVVVEKPGESQ